MRTLRATKPVLAAALVLGSLFAATGARAQGLADAFISVTVGAPVRHVQAAPVYVPPAPVHVQPRHLPARDPRAQSRGPWGDADRDGVPNRYDRRDDRRVAMNGPWGDADRDGVPNRHDRAPYNPRFR